MTQLESLKAKAEKKKAEVKQLENEIKKAELAELKVAEQIAKLNAVASEIAEAADAILEKEKISLPEGKQIILVAGANGKMLINILNGKPVKKRAGNGGAKAIEFEGKQMSWAGLCELKGIARTPSGSAHRDVFNKARELHDAIPHQCQIDGKTYPIS